MNKVLGVIIGAVGGIGFLWAAISIFVWDVGKLQQALQTLLYVPMPWVFWHMQQLMSREMEDGTSVGFRSLLMEARRDPHLRRSLLVCIGGFVYFVVICGAWMIYGSALGIL